MASKTKVILIITVLTCSTPRSRAQDSQNSTFNPGLFSTISDVSANINHSFPGFLQYLIQRQPGSSSVLANVLGDQGGALVTEVSKYIVELLELIQSNQLKDVLQMLRGFNGSTETKPGGQDQCAVDFIRVLNGITNREQWAMKMFDAVGKPGSGVLKGTHILVGNFDECLETESPVNQELRSDHVIRGHYCLLNFKTPLLMPISVLSGSVPSVQWQICIPKSCGSVYITDAMRKVPLERLNLTLLSVECKTPKSMKGDHSAIAALTIVAIIGALSLIGTIFDTISANMWRKKDEFKLTPIENGGHLGPAAFTREGTDLTINTDKNGVVSDNVTVTSVQEIPLQNQDSECLPVADDSTTKANTAETAGLGRKLLLCFSILKNTEKILGTRTSGGNLGCLHGIRVLSMGWVILGHSFIWSIGITDRNPKDVSELSHTFAFQAVMNAPLAVDTFFLMSGCLVTYLFLRETQKVGKITCRNMVLYYVHRFWRLTPVYMIALMVFVCISGYMIEGPLEQPVPNRESCYTNWWTNLLYINNVCKAKDMCMGWSWYLADDMQFYIVAPLALIPLALGYTLVGLLVIVAFIITHLVTNAYFLHDMDDLPFQLRQQRRYEIYFRPYSRVAPYAIGMILGYILYKTKCKVRIPRYALVIGCQIAIAIGLLCNYISYDYSAPGATEWGRPAKIIHKTIERPCWALAVGWLIFMCCTGYGGTVNKILSWKPWIPLGRLTYAAYLVHGIVLTVVEMNRRALTYYTITFFSYEFLGTFVISYAAAYLFSVLVEAPCLGLEKVVLKR